MGNRTCVSLTLSRHYSPRREAEREGQVRGKCRDQQFTMPYFLYATIIPSRMGVSDTIQSVSVMMARVKRRIASVFTS